MKSEYDFSQLRPLLDSAGITIDEASHLFKVSRPTLYSWCEGHSPVQPLLISNSEKLIRLIEKAVAAKSLPLVDVEPEKRKTEIVAALRKHLN